MVEKLEGIEIILYSERKLNVEKLIEFRDKIAEYNEETHLTPRIIDCVRAVLYFVHQYKKLPAAHDISQILDIKTHWVSNYLKRATEAGLLSRELNYDSLRKAKYLYKPNYEIIKMKLGEEFIEESEKMRKEEFKQRKRKIKRN